MPITYVGGWVIVTGDYSGSTNIFEQIYNASVGGAWGIETQLPNRMQLAPTQGIQFGQVAQGTPTIYKSQNENVICTTRIRWGFANVSFSTTGTIGVYDAVNDSTSDGCNIEYTTPSAGAIVLDANSILNVYDSNLIDNQPGNLTSAGFDGVVEMVDVNLWYANGWGFWGSGSNFNRLKARTNLFGILSASGQTWNEIRCNLCYNAMSVLGDGNIQNTTLINAVNYTIGAYDVLLGGTFFDFINCVMDFTDFVYYIDHTRVYRQQFTIDITCQTKDGTPIQGINIKAWDDTQDILVDSPLFDVNTGAGGDIAQQTITVATHSCFTEPERPFGTYTSLNDITFFISKIGWTEVKIVQTVDEAVDWTLEMTELEKESLRE